MEKKQIIKANGILSAIVRSGFAVVCVALTAAAVVGSIALLCWLWRLFMGVVA